jgi:hypothetical protein
MFNGGEKEKEQNMVLSMSFFLYSAPYFPSLPSSTHQRLTVSSFYANTLIAEIFAFAMLSSFHRISSFFIEPLKERHHVQDSLFIVFCD